MTGQPVRWGQPPLSFEVHSNDGGVLARAALILRPWSRPPAVPRPPHAWRIDPGKADASVWRVCGSAGGEPLACHSIAAAVRAVEFLAVQALFEWPSVCSLHGALVARRGEGALLLGRGEAGKSTLACALWRRGWALLGDDMALVDAAAGLAWSAPRRVALRAGSRALLDGGLWERLLATPAGEETSDGCLFDPGDLDGQERAGPVRLRALVFLGRPPRGSGHGAHGLAPAHALLALLPYTNLALRQDAGEVIRRLRPLAEAVPAYDLPRAPLDAMVAAVEGLPGDGR